MDVLFIPLCAAMGEERMTAMESLDNGRKENRDGIAGNRTRRDGRKDRFLLLEL